MLLNSGCYVSSLWTSVFLSIHTLHLYYLIIVIRDHLHFVLCLEKLYKYVFTCVSPSCTSLTKPGSMCIISCINFPLPSGSDTLEEQLELSKYKENSSFLLLKRIKVFSHCSHLFNWSFRVFLVSEGWELGVPWVHCHSVKTMCNLPKCTPITHLLH